MVARTVWVAAWHACALLAIAMAAPWVVVDRAPWSLTRANAVLVAGLILVYLGSAIAISRAARRPRTPGGVVEFAIVVTCLAAIYLGAILTPSYHYSRKLLVVASFVMAFGLLLPMLLPNARIMRRAVVLLVAVVLLGSLSAMSVRDVSGGRRSIESRPLSASQQFLRATYFRGYFGPAARPTSGGGIVRDEARGGYVLVRARGDVYRVHFDRGSGDVLKPLAIRVPLNAAEFEADIPPGSGTQAFRVADVALRRHAGKTLLYASHHYWKREQRCFVVRVSFVELPDEDRAPRTPQQWETLFESSPCLRVAPSRGLKFAGQQIGGNLEFLDSRRLLVTLGDHQFDGWYRPENLVRDPRAHYGKTVLIDVATGRSSTFTIGHRNPQGLAVDSQGRVWSTEHGPQGGDELNLLRPGGDYGYPTHSYGTEYGAVTWPPGEGRVGKDTSIRPTFAWVPSIGISDLVVVNDPAFERWRGDLLIASLRGNALWRVRLEQERVAYAEPIQIGERIRDISSGPGEIVLWTDSDSLIQIRPDGEVNEGSVAFAMHCGGCHDDLEHRIGPNLHGVLQRSVASAPGYSYSDALRRLRGHWDKERLQAFLASPDSVAPGTTMRVDGVGDPTTRERIVRYLESYY